MEYFEVKAKDLLGRIGRLYTSHGVVETPAIAPVVNPVKQVIEPKEIFEMGYQLIMTNAYIIKKNYGELAKELSVHGLLGVERPIMTDSGAYQILEYGKVEVGPEEILKYQEEIGSDIGVILDIPTRYEASFEEAKLSVLETLRRAREALKLRGRKDFLLVGPVQGGKHLELVRYAAKELAKMPFDIYAIGSPTPLMEEYRFGELVRIIIEAKLSLPVNKPVHLFGAGHPMMLSLAVALGADLFDSASYALYARDGRYMTPTGTYRLSELDELPCSCPICSKLDAKELKEVPEEERYRALALHNLYVLASEVKLIKEAIREGRLWELVEVRANAHPSLKDGVKQLIKYRHVIEEYDPVMPSKLRGIFFLSTFSPYRPEVIRYRSRLRRRYSPPKGVKVLLLIPEVAEKPFHRSKEVAKLLSNAVNSLLRKVHVCIYSYPFGVVPLELDDVYPLSQYEATLPPTFKYHVLKALRNYLKAFKKVYEAVVIYGDSSTWGEKFYRRLISLSKSLGLKVKALIVTDPYSDSSLRELRKVLHSILNP